MTLKEEIIETLNFIITSDTHMITYEGTQMEAPGIFRVCAESILKKIENIKMIKED